MSTRPSISNPSAMLVPPLRRKIRCQAQQLLPCRVRLRCQDRVDQAWVTPHNGYLSRRSAKHMLGAVWPAPLSLHRATSQEARVRELVLFWLPGDHHPISGQMANSCHRPGIRIHHHSILMMRRQVLQNKTVMMMAIRNGLSLNVAFGAGR